MKFYREVTDEMKYLTALYIDSDVNCREVAYYTIGSFFNKIIILDDIENALNVYMNNNIDLIFLDTDIDTINILKETRNQIMHTGMIGDGVLLNYIYEKEIEYIPQNNEIKINPYKMLKAIEEDFENYIQKLKEPKNENNKKLIENFKKVFNSYYNDEITHLA